jgi:hypothetical protein
VLELARGKVAVEVGGEKDLIPTLELIKTAVLNGELDTQIEAAALKLTNDKLISANTNCREKRHLISKSSRQHGSPAETNPDSTICAHG